MKEKLNKMKFIHNQLSPLIKKIDSDIIRLVYFIDRDDEFINIVFRGGYIKKVIVTADSLSAITKDVLRAVE